MCVLNSPQDGSGVVLQIFAPAKCHVTLLGIIGQHAAADTRHDEARTRSGTFLRGQGEKCLFEEQPVAFSVSCLLLLFANIILKVFYPIIIA